MYATGYLHKKVNEDVPVSHLIEYDIWNKLSVNQKNMEGEKMERMSGEDVEEKVTESAERLAELADKHPELPELREAILDLADRLEDAAPNSQVASILRKHLEKTELAE